MRSWPWRSICMPSTWPNFPCCVKGAACTMRARVPTWCSTSRGSLWLRSSRCAGASRPSVPWPSAAPPLWRKAPTTGGVPRSKSCIRSLMTTAWVMWSTCCCPGKSGRRDRGRAMMRGSNGEPVSFLSRAPPVETGTMASSLADALLLLPATPPASSACTPPPAPPLLLPAPVLPAGPSTSLDSPPLPWPPRVLPSSPLCESPPQKSVRRLSWKLPGSTERLPACSCSACTNLLVGSRP
mmetsp:Transcript_109229/g.352618  ORF Transcript_109229/g.352618 Transcript_109229/m.352618 type:complete len:239 (+) Transcript_109229:1824-2540(+)